MCSPLSPDRGGWDETAGCRAGRHQKTLGLSLTSSHSCLFHPIPFWRAGFPPHKTGICHHARTEIFKFISWTKTDFPRMHLIGTPTCPLQSSLRPKFTPCCSWSGVDFPVNASDLFPIMNCSLLCLLILILFPLDKEFSLTIELFKEICLWTHCFQMLCITLSDNSNLKHFVKSISKVSWTQWNREKAELWKI